MIYIIGLIVLVIVAVASYAMGYNDMQDDFCTCEYCESDDDYDFIEGDDEDFDFEEDETPVEIPFQSFEVGEKVKFRADHGGYLIDDFGYIKGDVFGDGKLFEVYCRKSDPYYELNLHNWELEKTPQTEKLVKKPSKKTVKKAVKKAAPKKVAKKVTKKGKK